VTRSSHRSLGLWIILLIVVAVVSFIIDQNTGDTTGPPFHDSFLNQGAFIIFFLSLPVLLVLVAIAVVQSIRGRRSD
jgi:uncharacterized membrane protein